MTNGLQESISMFEGRMATDPVTTAFNSFEPIHAALKGVEDFQTLKFGLDGIIISLSFYYIKI